MRDAKRIYLQTYGCTLNQADSDIIIGELAKNGHTVVESENEADVVIVNTCTVKEATENKICDRIEKIAETKKPLIVAGCLSINEKRIRKIAPSCVILGTGAIKKINNAINAAVNGRAAIFGDFERKDELSRVFTAPILRIPICEGCTSNCYFCQTKLARPGLRSYRPKTIVCWIEEGLQNGAKEIQLTAMDSGVYGLDLAEAGKMDLPELINRVNGIDGDFFVRLGMINPQHAKKFGERLVEAIKLPKIYKFLHVPVQTGSEKICKAMNRNHTVREFNEIIKKYRKEIPGISIATDIIVGYPSETNGDFEETLELTERSELDVINISKFSARLGTRAKEMKKLPTQEVKRRSEIASAIAKKMCAKRNEKFIGEGYEVLITEKQRDFTGRNMNYKQVVVKNAGSKEIKLGERIFVEIIDANHGALFGRRI